FAVARSGLPSPFMSPTTTDCGEVPTAKGDPMAGENPPEPFPNWIVTLLEVRFATARSRRPSPFRSPAATECGADPAAYDPAWANAAGARQFPDRQFSPTV